MSSKKELLFLDSYKPFQKDLKILNKRYKSIFDDLEIIKKVSIPLLHIHNEDNHSIVKIEGKCRQDLLIMKIRHVACKSLKTKGKQSGIRIIYAYDMISNRVIFIEIYYKGDKENHDEKRILDFIKAFDNRNI